MSKTQSDYDIIETNYVDFYPDKIIPYLELNNDETFSLFVSKLVKYLDENNLPHTSIWISHIREQDSDYRNNRRYYSFTPTRLIYDFVSEMADIFDLTICPKLQLKIDKHKSPDTQTVTFKNGKLVLFNLKQPQIEYYEKKFNGNHAN